MDFQTTHTFFSTTQARAHDANVGQSGEHAVPPEQPGRQHASVCVCDTFSPDEAQNNCSSKFTHMADVLCAHHIYFPNICPSFCSFDLYEYEQSVGVN